MAKPKELERYESEAICRANEKTREQFFTAILCAAYDLGADRIADITPEMMDQICERATQNGELILAQKNTLIEYSEAMKEIVRNEIPF